MFWSGYHSIIFRVIPLHSGDEGDAHAGGEEGIFAVGFLAASPAGVAEDVDVGSPEIEADAGETAMADVFMMLGAGFGADDDGHVVNERRVEGCTEADGLWENGGDIPCDAVQGFAPPVVGGDFQAWDGGGQVHD